MSVIKDYNDANLQEYDFLQIDNSTMSFNNYRDAVVDGREREIFAGETYSYRYLMSKKVAIHLGWWDYDNEKVELPEVPKAEEPTEEVEFKKGDEFEILDTKDLHPKFKDAIGTVCRVDDIDVDNTIEFTIDGSTQFISKHQVKKLVNVTKKPRAKPVKINGKTFGKKKLLAIFGG